MTTEYEYRDERGNVLYVKVRNDGKKFYFDRELDGLPNVPYRLPELIKAVKAGKKVAIVEGEKDADRMHSIGVPATTLRDGSNGKLPPGFKQHFKGATVAIVADRDVPGFKHARRLHAELEGVAAEVAIVAAHPEVRTEGADVSDHLDAGYGLADLTPVESPGITLQPMAAVQRTHVTWLWQEWVPLKSITILEGDPDKGKSTITLDIAARVSTGRDMPDGSPGSRGAVLIISGEDEVAATVKGRLEAAGADQERVYPLSKISEGTRPDGTRAERRVNLTDMEEIRKAAERVGARLIVVDPLTLFMPPGMDEYRDKEVRQAIDPLKILAEDLNAAVIVVRHMTKQSGGKAMYRGGGSIGLIGSARSGLLAAEHPEEADKYILARVKANLAKSKGKALVYSIETVGNDSRIKWEGHAAIAADDLTGGADNSAVSEAIQWLDEYLTLNGEMPLPQIKDAAWRHSKIPDWTLRRARRKLKITARRSSDFPSHMIWSLDADVHSVNDADHGVNNMEKNDVSQVTNPLLSVDHVVKINPVTTVHTGAPSADSANRQNTPPAHAREACYSCGQNPHVAGSAFCAGCKPQVIE